MSAATDTAPARPHPATGAELLNDAAVYVATAAKHAEITASRALLAVGIGDTDDRQIDFRTWARAWAQRHYGDAAAWLTLYGDTASGALTRCACDLANACEKGDCDAPVGGRALAGYMSRDDLAELDAWLTARWSR